MSTIINIFAFLGFIFLLSVFIYYVYKYFKNKQLLKDISLVYPPGDYMQETGIKCPDYWVNSGTDSNGNYECQNRFNIPVIKNRNASCENVNCTATNDNNKAYFNSVPNSKTWEIGNPNGLKSMSDQEKYDFLTGDAGSATSNRCNWINCCGGSAGTKSPWTGVYDICQNPNPSQVAK